MRKRLKNLLRQLLVIEISLPVGKRSLYLGSREISRNITDQELNSPEVRQAIAKKLVKAVKGLPVARAAAPKVEPKVGPKVEPRTEPKVEPEAVVIPTSVEESVDEAPDTDNQDRGVRGQ